MAHDVQAYGKFCITHGIINDGSQDDRHNADLVLNYFENTWKEVITAETLERALPALRPHLKFKSKARVEFEKVAAGNPAAAHQLGTWLDTQGKSGQLVNTGDDMFENLSLLLGTLQGYEISTPRIQDAENRIANRAGRKLHYVPTPRRTEPVSRHAKEDDGTPFVTQGLTLQRDGSLGKSPADYAREARARSERDAAEEASQRSGVSAQSRTAAEAKSKAESIQGATHSETDQLKKIFITSGTEIDWPATYASRLQMQKQFNRHRETVRFIR